MWYNTSINRLPSAMLETSDGCMLNGVAHLMRKYTPQEQIASFWNKVAITANDDLCWEWQGRLDNGYGSKRWYGNKTLTHRISWIIAHGDIKDNMSVLHSCDNRACVNPKYLFLGTQQDNMDDMKIKGRQSRLHGEKNGRAKLTVNQVNEIRSKYANKQGSLRTLAIEYGMGKTTISEIISGESWSKS